MIDDQGRARSSRQGAITLSKRNIHIHRPGWQMCRIPAARVWLAVVTPDYLVVDGVERPTTQAWRKRQWKKVWSALVPSRRVAMRQWVEETTWTTAVRRGQVALGNPRTLRYRIRVNPPTDQPDGQPAVYYTDLPGDGAEPLVVADNEQALLVQRCQPALWRGDQITRTAAPVWVPHIAQHEIGLIAEEEIVGERTAGRQYAPRMRAAA